MHGLVREPEFPEWLLEEAVGMMGCAKKSLRMAFAYELADRPKLSLRLVDLVVEWSRDFTDENVEDDWDSRSVGFAIMSTLYHAPRSSPAAIALLSKLLDHPYRPIGKYAAVTLLKLVETETDVEAEYNPLIVKGLIECLNVRSRETRLSVLSQLKTILDLRLSTYERLIELVRDGPLYLKFNSRFSMGPLYDRSEEIKKALIELAETGKSENISSAIPESSEGDEAQATPGNRGEIASRTLQYWKDKMCDVTYEKKLDSIEDALLQRLSRSEYQDDELATLNLDVFLVDVLFEILRENDFEGLNWKPSLSCSGAWASITTSWTFLLPISINKKTS